MTGDPQALPGEVVVAGIGNELRGDDGVGPAVALQVRRRGHPASWLVRAVADPLELLELWTGCRLSVVVDATCSGAAPGTVVVHELTGTASPGRSAAGAASTHVLGLAAVVALAGALGRAPERVVLVGVEGDTFEPGAGLSPAVAAAVADAAGRVLDVGMGAIRCA